MARRSAEVATAEEIGGANPGDTNFANFANFVTFAARQMCDGFKERFGLAAESGEQSKSIPTLEEPRDSLEGVRADQVIPLGPRRRERKKRPVPLWHMAAS